uniref:Secreted protein n=1 Tax=Bursaphelenchus xylophilus TaxID=6326 RepID=A0A1I7SM06_BURXY
MRLFRWRRLGCLFNRDQGRALCRRRRKLMSLLMTMLVSLSRTHRVRTSEIEAEWRRVWPSRERGKGILLPVLDFTLIFIHSLAPDLPLFETPLRPKKKSVAMRSARLLGPQQHKSIAFKSQACGPVLTTNAADSRSLLRRDDNKRPVLSHPLSQPIDKGSV